MWKKIDIFKSGGGKRITQKLDVPYLGTIPIDPKVCNDSDNGIPFIAEKSDSPTAEAFNGIINKIKQTLKKS